MSTLVLRIDDAACDLDRQTEWSLTIRTDRMGDAHSGRKGPVWRTELPSTPRNRQLFGEAAWLNGATEYAQSTHRAMLESEGSELFRGEAMLEGVVRTATGTRYRIALHGDGDEWAEHAAQRMFNQIPVEYAAPVGEQEIRASWEGDERLVRYLPVVRDRYPLGPTSDRLSEAHTPLSVEDYHPFLHVRTLLARVVEAGGYTLESRFLDGELFRSLYMSGRYHTRRWTLLEARMDFRAGRTTSATAAADAAGRVWADPFMTLHSVGALVDTAVAVDAATADCFDRGGCMRTAEGELCFRPPYAVTVGFAVRMRYTTDYRILSRHRLAGFCSVRLGAENAHRFTLANRYEDQRDKLVPGAYRLMIFDHASGYIYRFYYQVNGVDRIAVYFSLRNCPFTVPEGTYPTNTRLVWRLSTEETYRPWTQDWAIYPAYAEEKGRTEVDVTVRLAPRPLSPSRPQSFRTFCFEGAEPGMQLTLGADVRVWPLLEPHPVLGQQVCFADIAEHEVRQITLIEALAHLFDLCFYTDRFARRLYVEPFDSFHDPTRIADWTDRIDGLHPFLVKECGGRVHERLTLCYGPGDGATARYNVRHHEDWGSWSTALATRLAKAGEDRRENRLFVPSLSEAAPGSDAPSARLVRVGDREGALSDTDRNFPPKIVRWFGMEPLPDGEVWSYPHAGGRYPLASFHCPEKGFSLCFEDREGATGLHACYRRELHTAEHARAVWLGMRLSPHDVAGLLSPNGFDPDLRTLFRLEIEGETGLYTLDAVEGYDPRSGTTLCCFTQYAG